MKSWKETAELVGIGAVVASLVFVALQIRQSQDIAIAETRATRQASLVELNNGIAEHADTWAKGISGEPLSPAEQVVFERLVNNLHYQYWTSFDRTRRFGQETSLALTVADFAMFLYDNPGARRVWTEYVDGRESRRHILVPTVDYNQNRFMFRVLEDLEKLDAAEGRR